MVARCVARQPSVIDFVCGLKLNLSSGTRSSDLRVLPISWSNSGRSALLTFLLSCGSACGCAAIMPPGITFEQMIVLIKGGKRICRRKMGSVLILLFSLFVLWNLTGVYAFAACRGEKPAFDSHGWHWSLQGNRVT